MLATLDYLEQQRRLEHDATRSANDEIAERWQTITRKTQDLRELNQHNGWLLEGQIERNQQAIQVLKPHQNRRCMAQTVKPLLRTAAGKILYLMLA